jgi:hypothetical protein
MQCRTKYVTIYEKAIEGSMLTCKMIFSLVAMQLF